MKIWEPRKNQKKNDCLLLFSHNYENNKWMSES